MCLLRTYQQRSFHGRTWIITTFVLIDTAMTNLDHQTDVRAGVPESEIATVARVAAKYFAIIIESPLVSCKNSSTYQDQSAIPD